MTIGREGVVADLLDYRGVRLRGRRVPVLEGALDRVELVANLLGGGLKDMGFSS